MAEVLNTDDVFDSRDLLAHIYDLEALPERNDYEDYELLVLKSVVNQFHEIYDEKDKFLNDGVTFIRESYFLDFQTEFFLEVNQVDEALHHYIDFQGFADAEMLCHSEVMFDGVAYYFRDI